VNSTFHFHRQLGKHLTKKTSAAVSVHKNTRIFTPYSGSGINSKDFFRDRHGVYAYRRSEVYPH
jgi:hypothetical protein